MATAEQHEELMSMLPAINTRLDMIEARAYNTQTAIKEVNDRLTVITSGLNKVGDLTSKTFAVATSANMEIHSLGSHARKIDALVEELKPAIDKIPKFMRK